MGWEDTIQDEKPEAPAEWEKSIERPPLGQGTGMLDKMKNAYDAVSPGAMYEKQNPGHHVVGMTVANNPAIMSGAVPEAAAESIPAVASTIAQRFATSPIPSKLAEMTHLSPAVSYAGKAAQEPFHIANMGARAAQGAQNVVGKIVDSVSNSKYASILKGAAARGGNALATTDFLLQQRDPEYSKLKKDLSE